MSTDHDPDLLESFATDFLQYEDALTDPFITDVFKEVKEFNMLLATEATTDDEARQIIATLDAMWAPIIGTEITVSGRVTFLDPDNEPFTEYYDEVRMISNGFFMIGDAEVSGPQMGRRVVLQFHWEIPDDRKEAYKEVTQGTHLVGTSLIEDVTLTLDGVSVDRAKAWLGVFAPDLIDRVDAAVLNTNGSPSEVMTALQELDLTTELEEPDASFALECLGVYINDVVSFDRKLPYLVEIRGRLIIKDHSGQDVYASLSGAAQYLVYVHDLLAIEVEEKSAVTGDVTKHGIDIFLQSTLVNAQEEGSDLRARIPVDSINSFESIRPLAYTEDPR